MPPLFFTERTKVYLVASLKFLPVALLLVKTNFFVKEKRLNQSGNNYLTMKSHCLDNMTSAATKIDEVDTQILHLLLIDARLSLRKIAKECKISSVSVYNRIEP
jgi:hypothetical protein